MITKSDLPAIAKNVTTTNFVIVSVTQQHSDLYHAQTNTGHINVMLVLQSCKNSLQVLPGSSGETFPTSSDGTCDVGNVEVEADLDMQGQEDHAQTFIYLGDFKQPLL